MWLIHREEAGMDDDADRLRLWLTFGVAVVGIALVMVAFLITVLTFKDASQPGELIPAVLGGVTAAIGTLAGLVAGHTAGSAGKERAERRADAREQEAAAGRTLAESLKVDEAILPAPRSRGSDVLGSSEDPQIAALLRRQVELAKRPGHGPLVRRWRGPRALSQQASWSGWNALRLPWRA
jgi:hypothetical protein